MERNCSPHHFSANGIAALTASENPSASKKWALEREDIHWSGFPNVMQVVRHTNHIAQRLKL